MKLFNKRNNKLNTNYNIEIKKEDFNEKRAIELIEKYQFNYDDIPKREIIQLINDELLKYSNGSSEYLRLLCGYLCCIGEKEDAKLIKKVKYEIDMDVGCMVDSNFIEALENEDKELVNEIKKELKEYYKNYFK